MLLVSYRDRCASPQDVSLGDNGPVTVLIDPRELRARWIRQWRDCRPIGHELRSCSGDRWVRFHSLPESKRYFESDTERHEILLRHNTVIDELVSRTDDSGDTVLVVTCAWSGSSKPVPRDDAVHAASPHAVYWQSVLREADEDYESWTHLYVDVVAWQRGAIDDVLVLVANCGTADAFVAPMNLEWLYHPYDGGADVIAPSTARRDAIRDEHRDWLSQQPEGL